MSDDVQTIPVEATFKPSDVAEIMEAPEKTDAELVRDALKSFAEMMDQEGAQTGGGKPEKKRGESREDYEARLAEYEAQREAQREARRLAREEEAAREAAGLGDGSGEGAPTADVAMAGTALAPAPTPPPPAAKRTATEGPGGKPAPAPSRFPEASEEYDKLAEKIDGLSGDAAKAADRAAAWLFRNLPGFVKASVGGAVLKAGIDNPYSVRWIGKTLLKVAEFFVERFQTTADWSMYKTAIEMLAADVGEFASTVRDAATAGPGFAIAVTLLIMRYRANQEGGAGSVTGQIAADIKALRGAGVRLVSSAVGAGAGAAPTATEVLEQVASYMWSGIVNAASAVRSKSADARLEFQRQLRLARGEATVAALRQGARNTQQGPGGPGTADLRRKTTVNIAPAAEAGVEPGAVRLAPAKPDTPAPATAFDKNGVAWGLPAKKLPKAEVKEEQALGAGAGAPGLAIRAPEPVVGKRRRLSEARGTPMGRRASAPAVPVTPAAAMQVDKPEEEATGEGAGAGAGAALGASESGSGDVAMSGTEQEKKEKKDGGRRKTRGKKRKTYRKKGKTTRGKTRGRRAFIY